MITIRSGIRALLASGRPGTRLLPDHEFFVAVDVETGATGALRFGGGDGTFYSKGDTGKTGEVLYNMAGADFEFPADSEISLDLVRQAAREFLTSGGRLPTCLTWQQVTH